MFLHKNILQAWLLWLRCTVEAQKLCSSCVVFKQAGKRGMVWSMCCSKRRQFKGVDQVVCGSCTEGQMEVWFCKVCKEVANTNITLQLTCAERTQHSPAAGMEQSNHQSGSLRMSVRKGIPCAMPESLDRAAGLEDLFF